MKIVLIYPPNDMYRVSYNVKTKNKGKHGHQPPLGLGYVAAIAENAGHEIKIVDGVANAYSIEQCADIVKNLNPDLVGISVMTHVKNETALLSQRIKQLMPEIPIVIGGSHAYYFYEDILTEMPSVDFVLYGEIEYSWEKFLSNINVREKWDEIDGLCYRNADSSITINKMPGILENLDELPFPSWHLYDFSLYKPLPFQSKGDSFFALITSRGCAWGKCKFCYQAGRKKQKYRRHSPERVVQEIKHLNDTFGINDIAFWDDTFPTSLNWLKEFKNLLQKKPLSINFTCSTKVSFLTKEKMQLLKDVGCWSIFLGIESGNIELLQIIDKGIQLEQARNVVQWANEIGIETRCAYMLGLPGETPEKGKETIDFAKQLDSTYAIFYATHPRYGTELYEIALSHGNFLSREFKGMTGITYVPEGYKNEIELQHMVRKAYLQFYLRPKQIMKYLKKINSISSLKEAFFAFELFIGLKN